MRGNLRSEDEEGNMFDELPDISNEDLELVAVDAELIRTMVRTQGEILAKLDMVIDILLEMDK